VSEDLSQGISKCCQHLSANNCISWQSTKEEALTALFKEWRQQEGGTRQILAQRNVDVDALNEGARDSLRGQEVGRARDYLYDPAGHNGLCYGRSGSTH
jgi:hypothetical protein